MILGKLPLYRVWKARYGTHFKRRRFERIMKLVPLSSDHPVRILEVGCSSGKDFIQFLDGPNVEIWGVDLDDDAARSIQPSGFHFVHADAEQLPFEDKFFDLVVSIGLLEHIEPMEKLCRVIAEFDRVGVHQLSVIPSVSTIIEPHCGRLFFPRRLEKTMIGDQPGQILHLNFLSDHSWTKFEGFRNCQVTRLFYIAPLIQNTVVYR